MGLARTGLARSANGGGDYASAAALAALQSQLANKEDTSAHDYAITQILTALDGKASVASVNAKANADYVSGVVIDLQAAIAARALSTDMTTAMATVSSIPGITPLAQKPKVAVMTLSPTKARQACCSKRRSSV